MKKKTYNFIRRKLQHVTKNSYLSSGLIDLATDINKLLIDKMNETSSISNVKNKFLFKKNSKQSEDEKFEQKLKKAVKYLSTNNNLKISQDDCAVCVSGDWIKIQFVRGTPLWAIQTVKKYLEKNKMFYNDKQYKWSRPMGKKTSHPYIALGPWSVNFNGWSIHKYAKLGLVNVNKK